MLKDLRNIIVEFAVDRNEKTIEDLLVELFLEDTKAFNAEKNSKTIHLPEHQPIKLQKQLCLTKDEETIFQFNKTYYAIVTTFSLFKLGSPKLCREVAREKHLVDILVKYWKTLAV
jgi:hypothetical protein